MSFKTRHILFICASLLLVILGFHLYQNHKKDQKSAEILQGLFNEGEQIILGEKSAKNTVVLFYDYDCPVCRRFFSRTYPLLKEEIAHEKVNILLKPVNLNGDDLRSETYALLYCLNHIGLFNELHEILLIESDFMYHSDFMIFKEELFNENIEIQACVESFESENIINENKILLKKLGYHSLPLIFIGNRAFSGHTDAQLIKRYLK